MAELSPMMKQYMEIKESYQDCILFFRLGDFYEMFFDDAIKASKELELVLTGRNCGQEEKAPMCGIPFHAADSYIQRLVEKGYKVAICEQVEDPALAKNIVKREVIQIVTPGTLVKSEMLKENENNYICSVFLNGNTLGFSYSDISTGELNITEYEGTDSYEVLLNELVKVKPSEIIVSESFKDCYGTSEIKAFTDGYINVLADSYFSKAASVEVIKSQFSVIGMTPLGLEDRDELIASLGALLSYLIETQKKAISQITHFSYYEIGSHMSIDKSTLRNLEITESIYGKSNQGTLLSILDKTHTAMGARLLKKWLKEPLNVESEIIRRLDGVTELYSNILLRNNIKEYLKKIYDFERIIGRIASGNANARDMIALKQSLSVLPDIKYELSGCESEILTDINNNINDLKDICDLIEKAIVEDPPFTVKEGKIIKHGYSEELDNIKFSIKDGKTWISNLEQVEKEKTGIRTLKVGFNKVFGYYIEVSNSFKDQVPENYIRKQTLVNGERFITPELKEMENLVLNAEFKINDLEYRLFTEIRETIKKNTDIIQNTSRYISMLDCLTSFAHVSDRLGYVRPEINSSYDIEIVKGRHPVIEQTVKNGIFVSNDVYLDNSKQSLLLITGPNMAGKSTYMRQTALIVLMAQAGCYVPCESAKIGIVDRIFTRIGASDNLSQGESTFYVEMSELSYILSSAKERSLIILDEIGRGTSTYDGLSIAWATVEYLCNKSTHIRTLFATHYHELTVLEDEIEGVRNLNVDVSDDNGNIVFLHKIVPGATSRSYGIHVAKLAGVPKTLLRNAESKLKQLENSSSGIKIVKQNEPQIQLGFFDLTPDPIIARLRSLDLMEVTPSQAIKILEELKDNL
ncbi:MAG: DNA mismatch repair protein MutS [Clostridia bacterium]|nr:DNA mismatch repair protein MutS [Clostridia bacterium]